MAKYLDYEGPFRLGDLLADPVARGIYADWIEEHYPYAAHAVQLWRSSQRFAFTAWTVAYFPGRLAGANGKLQYGRLSWTDVVEAVLAAHLEDVGIGHAWGGEDCQAKRHEHYAVYVLAVRGARGVFALDADRAWCRVRRPHPWKVFPELLYDSFDTGPSLYEKWVRGRTDATQGPIPIGSESKK